MRPSPIGSDLRFEKFILAVQALRLDYGPGSDRTDSTEAMRAPAEEIFSIDGVPQLFPAAAIARPRIKYERSGADERSAAGAVAPADSAAVTSEDAPATAQPVPDAGRSGAGETDH